MPSLLPGKREILFKIQAYVTFVMVSATVPTPRQDSKMPTCWLDPGRSKWLPKKGKKIFHLESQKVQNFCSLKS
jgi:hypothetical protein